ncbi:MAG TPA: hypothetical protein VGQ15_06895 [Gaiellaceae bacterium]|nr:hypothetical protein [Gaiellaceae bacterium]
MFGLDERLAAGSDGASVLIVLGIAVLLGLRHATDPDHLAAVTTLVASGRERAASRAGELGLAWGLGHAATLFAFGFPIILFKSFLPQAAQHATESAVGFIIVYLALRLLGRWRRGELRFQAHPHAHGLAVASLALLAIFTAISMSILSSGFGLMLASRPAGSAFGAAAPALGAASLAFGIWYATAAWRLAPNPF